MKHTHRMAQFSKRLQDFMQRAEVSDTELARRIDSNRLTVWRWREAVALPREETIHRLKAGLWWQDHLGEKHELTNEELSQLRIAAGYYDLASEEAPIAWNRRIAAKSIPIGIHLMRSRRDGASVLSN